MQKSINMTFGFAGVRLLGFRVPGLGLGSDGEVLNDMQTQQLALQDYYAHQQQMGDALLTLTSNLNGFGFSK